MDIVELAEQFMKAWAACVNATGRRRHSLCNPSSELMELIEVLRGKCLFKCGPAEEGDIFLRHTGHAFGFYETPAFLVENKEYFFSASAREFAELCADLYYKWSKWSVKFLIQGKCISTTQAA